MEDENKPTEGESEDGAKPELGDAGKRALDNERKARRAAEKRLAELEAKVKETEDAEKSELQRLQDKVDELTKRAEAAEAKAHRYEVAAEKGLTPAQARRLVGATKEELEADADAMVEELGLKKPEEEKPADEETEEETPFGARPKENLKGGASNEEDEQPDPGKLADSILGSGW
jgi:hypothetical protein